MRSLNRSVTFGLMLLNLATIACAADGAGQDNNASPLVWVVLFFPAFVIIAMVFLFARKNRSLTLNSLKRFDEHRTFTEAHMRRLESQIENLDKRLIRMIELLETAEQRQRSEP